MKKTCRLRCLGRPQRIDDDGRHVCIKQAEHRDAKDNGDNGVQRHGPVQFGERDPSASAASGSAAMSTFR